jgi:predicted aconitase with swiveling domain
MEYKARVIQPWYGEIVGEVLITNSRISFLGDVDMSTGTIVGADLDIRGHNMKGKILVFSESRGSTVGSNVLYGLSRNGLAPKLIGTRRVEPITASGAIFGSIPMVSQLEENVFRELKNGDSVCARIDGGRACLERVQEAIPE